MAAPDGNQEGVADAKVTETVLDELPEWAKGRFTLEELRQMTKLPNLAECLELKDFLPELEAIVQEGNHGR